MKARAAGGWHLPYGVLMTLLFALFVVLFASSQADLTRLKKVSDAMELAFSGSASVGTVPVPLPSEALEPLTSSHSRSSAPVERTDEELDELERRVRQELSLLTAAGEVSVSRVPGGVAVELAQGQVFRPGEASIPEDLVPLLLRLGRMAARVRGSVRIEAQSTAAEGRSEPDSLILASRRAGALADLWRSALRRRSQEFELLGRIAPDPGKFAHLRVVFLAQPAEF